MMSRVRAGFALVSGSASASFRRPSRRIILRTAAVLIALELAAFAAWWVHDGWRRGQVELINSGAPLTVEVLDESGTSPVGEPIELITRATLRLPDGDYWVRLSGMGRLGQTYRLAVNRGDSIRYEVSLDRGRLRLAEPDDAFQEKSPAGPVPFHSSTAVLPLARGPADLVHAGRGTVLRRDGRTGAVIWDASRASPSALMSPFAAPRPAGPLVDPGPWVRAIADSPDAVAVVEPAPDLDYDGVRDIVWSYRNAPGILAMSGANGSVLWNYHAARDGAGGPRPTGPATWGIDSERMPDPADDDSLRGQILGEPALHDVDGDGTPDLIASVAFGMTSFGSPGSASDARGLDVHARSIVAVSGKTGLPLWRTPAGNREEGGRLDWRAVLVVGRRSTTVAFLRGSRWIGLDPKTGAPRGEPLELGDEPILPPRYGDLDGDGEPELLALMPAAGGPGMALSACSLTSRKRLWSAAITAPPATVEFEPVADWPWLVRLDADGTTAVIVPDDGPMPPGPGYRGVRRLDGRTGRTLWTRPMRPNPGMPDGPTYCVEAPDLDGDGLRDLVVAWCGAGRTLPVSSPLRRLYIDALSGKDGHPLWSWNRTAPQGSYNGVEAPVWWGSSPDGRPLLAVPAETADGVTLYEPFSAHAGPRMPVVHILEASTGRERHLALGLGAPRAADLDGDGVLDLWGQVDGKVAAFRGTLPETWRAFDSYSEKLGLSELPLAGDLDGDGIGDVLTSWLATSGELRLDPTGDPTAVARSGADGHVLWKARLGSPRSWFRADEGRMDVLIPLRAPAGDLDGDGVVDIAVSGQYMMRMPGLPGGAPGVSLRLLSGRTGRALWSAGAMPAGLVGPGGLSIDGRLPPLAVAIEPGGRPDLIVRSSTQRLVPPSAASSGILADKRLTRLSGRDGRVVWDVPLALRGNPAMSGPLAESPDPPIADVDGDGSADMLLFGPFPDEKGGSIVGLRAISLATGRPLWTHPLDADLAGVEQDGLAVGDLDGDGRAEVLLSSAGSTSSGSHARVIALDGRDGSVRWRWLAEPSDPPPAASGGPTPPPARPAAPRRLSFPPESLFASSGGPGHLTTIASDGRKGFVLLKHSPGPDALVLLDAGGKEVARRALPQDVRPGVTAIDLTGDGRDELIIPAGIDLHVFGPELEPLWSSPSVNLAEPWNPSYSWRAVPASAGRPGLIILPNGLVRNGPDGRRLGLGPRWGTDNAQVQLLESADPRRPLVWLLDRGNESACYRMLPDTPEAAGVPTPSLIADPRWQRPLPWVAPIRDQIGPRGFIVMIALALVNLAIPLALLKLAARRRPWTIRLLLALPVAAAIPLYALHAFEPMMLADFASTPVSPRRLYIAATLAGAPLVAFAGGVAWSLVRLRWKRLLAMAALLLVSSALVAAGWIAYDVRTMPPPGHYDRADWAMAPALVPGAGLAGSLLILGWILRRPIRWLMKPRRAAGAV